MTLQFSSLALGICFTLVTALSGCAGDPDEHASSDPLKDLGVDTQIGARRDPSGAEVSPDYNPTLRPVTQIGKRNEIFLGGLTADASNPLTPSGVSHVIRDWKDNAADFTDIHMAGDDSWLKLKKTMASGDLDGDGIDEIVVAYVTTPTDTDGSELAFKVIKRNGSGEYASVAQGSLARYGKDDITEYPDDNWWMNNFQAVCGDLDGNGQQETIVSFNGSVFVMGDSQRSYGMLKSIAYDKSAGRKLLKLAAGDVNNDGRDEVVVAEGTLAANDLTKGTSTYHVYGGLQMKELATGSITATKGIDTVTLRAASCAIGDLDGDGLNEVLFVGYPSQSQEYYALVLDTAWNVDTKQFGYSFEHDFVHFPGRAWQHPTPPSAIADFDGDGKKEILAFRSIYPNFSTSGGTFAATPKVADIYAPKNAIWLGSAWDSSLAVGDVDGDLGADVTYISDAFFEIYTLGFNSAGEWVRKGTGNLPDSGSNYPFVTVGDYDGDSLTVKFEKSELLFSDPHPIAVLAANPYWSGIDMQGQTSFGSTIGSEVEKEESIGFSVGVTFECETEDLFGLIPSASFEASFKSSFDWTATQSTSIEESYAYTTNNQDQVIFTTIPYDVYYYRVIQSPNRSRIGSMLTVNLPRQPITLPVERSFYNSNNGDAPDIDANVLKHTVGDPLSYPKKAEAAALVASSGGQGMISTKTLSVGEGPGSTSIEMSQTQGTGTGSSFDFAVETAAKFGTDNLKVGVTAGFHYGESYSIKTSSGTTYGGQVANIPAEDFSLDRSFNWGLFAYQGTLGAEKFVVVSYFTESNR